jgi:hypothetical protein
MGRIVIHNKRTWMPVGERLRESEWVPEGEGRRYMVVQYIYRRTVIHNKRMWMPRASGCVRASGCPKARGGGEKRYMVVEEEERMAE